ncbi:MAG TPA: DNA mismatch repair protein MutS, partial [Bacillota bacterium]|nr:DNA mismatch repair protein MutS [Bacillota bacterium]
DRTDGAYLVLEHLHASHIIGLMSTHDYELCSLAEKSKQDISYYSFTETYDDGLKFDYVLNEGVSTSSNARYLMKMLGID